MIISLLATAAMATPQSFEGHTFYVGDLHVHTAASGDGYSADAGAPCIGNCGNLEDVHELALGAGLDFMAITDHVNGYVMSDDKLFDFAHGVALDDPPEDLVVIPGAEIWFRLPDGSPMGHKNLLLLGDEEDFAGFTLADAQFDGRGEMLDDCEAIWEHASELEALYGPLLLLPHHPALEVPMVTEWSCHHQTYQPAVEIYSEHGNSDRSKTTFDPPWSGEVTRGVVANALDPESFGLRIGFIGGTDRHDTHPGDVCHLETVIDGPIYGGGVTMLLLEDGETLDRSSIHQAIAERRTYATSGPHVVVRAELLGADGRSLGEMGDEALVPKGEPLQLELRMPPEQAEAVNEAIAVTPTERLPMKQVKTGVWRIELSPDTPWVYGELILAGPSWYAGVPCVDGGTDTEEHVWLSPIWMDDQPSDLDEDGVSEAEGDCDDADPAVYPGADEDCTNSVDDDCDGVIDAEDHDCEDADDTAPPSDSSPPPPADSAEPVETNRDSGHTEHTGGKRSCGCSSAPPSGMLWLIGALGLGARRRVRGRGEADPTAPPSRVNSPTRRIMARHRVLPHRPDRAAGGGECAAHPAHVRRLSQ